MRVDQKLRNAARKKRRNGEKKNIQRVQRCVKIPEHNRDIEKDPKRFVNIGIIKCDETIKKNEILDYVSLFQILEEAKKDKMYVKKMDTRLVPYEISEFYSLQKEIDDIATIKKKIDVLSQKICREDTASMTSDWKKVGRDINEAIYKSRRIHADGSN